MEGDGPNSFTCILWGFLSFLVFSDQMGNPQNPCWMQKLAENFSVKTTSLENFHIISRIICFDDRDTRPVGRQRQASCNQVSVGQVGGFTNLDPTLLSKSSFYPFRQYIPSKSAKYGIKIWAACDAASSYVWNLHVYMVEARWRSSREEPRDAGCPGRDRGTPWSQHHMQ